MQILRSEWAFQALQKWPNELSPVWVTLYYMPWNFRYDAHLNTFFYLGFGVVTNHELVTGLAARTPELLLHPNARVFHDYTAVTDINIPSETFIKLAEKDLGRQSPLRRAILVTSPSVAGILRFIHSRDMKGELKVFFDRGSALRWLNEGLPPEQHIAGGPWHTLADLDAYLAQRKGIS